MFSKIATLRRSYALERQLYYGHSSSESNGSFWIVNSAAADSTTDAVSDDAIPIILFFDLRVLICCIFSPYRRLITIEEGTDCLSNKKAIKFLSLGDNTVFPVRPVKC